MAKDIKTIEDFLSGIYVATIATHNSDGSIHAVPIWYLYDDGAFYLPTHESSVKARNIVARPTATVTVDSRGPETLRAASTSGRAEVLTGQAAEPFNRRCWARYLTQAGMADADVGGLLASYDTACLRVAAGRWIWSDMGPPFKGKLENRELVRAYSP